MNIADRMEMEAGLKGGLARWMETHGRVLFDKSRSNAYAGVRIREILWKGIVFRIVDVDGMICEISRVQAAQNHVKDLVNNIKQK